MRLLKPIPVLCFRTPAGREPVREWMRALELRDRKQVGFELKRVQFGWPIGMPLCRSMGNGLQEMRLTLPGGRIARLLFYLDDGVIVLLHAFMKKTQKTPQSDLDLALRNKRTHQLGRST